LSIAIHTLIQQRQIIYRNGTLKGSIDNDNGRVLPSDYSGIALIVAQKRIVLAGYRLADVLEQIY
jgi:hypothetical protein